jgi:hypothetical protein
MMLKDYQIISKISKKKNKRGELNENAFNYSVSFVRAVALSLCNSHAGSSSH